MTQNREMAEKIAELHTIFLNLDETGKDHALTILKVLDFAQTAMFQAEKDKNGGCEDAK